MLLVVGNTLNPIVDSMRWIVISRNLHGNLFNQLWTRNCYNSSETSILSTNEYIYTWKQGGGGSKKLARKRSIQGVELGVRNEWSKWEFLDWPWQVVCTLSSRRERVTKGSGQARVGSSTTCLPLIPLVGQRWRGLVVGYRYERILERIPPSILTKRREVVNNESQVTTGGVLPRGDRKRARNFPLKVTKNELKFRKNFETSSLTVHLEKLWKNWKKEKRRKRENLFPPFSIDQSIKADSRFRKNGRMFRWKSARVRADFAYSEEAFRDYPHSNENCSIADWLGSSWTKLTPLSLSFLPSFSFFLFIVRLFSTLARLPSLLSFLTRKEKRERERAWTCIHTCTYTRIHENIFALYHWVLPLGPPALYYSPFSCPWTLLERRGPFVSRATHPRVRTRVARFGLHQPMFLLPSPRLSFSFFSLFCFSPILSARSAGRRNGLDIGGARVSVWNYVLRRSCGPCW